MKKIFLSTVLSGCFISSFAFELNGDFETCIQVQGIGLWAKDWHISRNVTKNAAVELCDDLAEVHSGKYALYMECAQDGRAYIYHHPLISVRKNEKLNISVFLKGEGKINTGFVVYGYTDNPKKLIHLTSVTSPKFIADKKRWRDRKWDVCFKTIQKDGIVYETFMLMPFLNMSDAGSALIDSYKVRKVEEKE